MTSVGSPYTSQETTWKSLFGFSTITKPGYKVAYKRAPVGNARHMRELRTNINKRTVVLRGISDSDPLNQLIYAEMYCANCDRAFILKQVWMDRQDFENLIKLELDSGKIRCKTCAPNAPKN